MIDNLNNNIVNNDDDQINDIVNVIDDENDNVVRENEINQPINQPINEETNVNQPNEPQNEQDNNEQPNNLSPELEEMKKYIPKLFFLVSFYMKCPTILLAEFLIISFNRQFKNFNIEIISFIFYNISFKFK